MPSLASLITPNRKGTRNAWLSFRCLVADLCLQVAQATHPPFFSAGAIVQLAINANNPSCLLPPEAPTEAHLIIEAKVEDRSLSSRAALRVYLALNSKHMQVPLCRVILLVLRRLVQVGKSSQSVMR